MSVCVCAYALCTIMIWLVKLMKIACDSSVLHLNLNGTYAFHPHSHTRTRLMLYLKKMPTNWRFYFTVAGAIINFITHYSYYKQHAICILQFQSDALSLVLHLCFLLLSLFQNVHHLPVQFFLMIAAQEPIWKCFSNETLKLVFIS